MTYPPIPPVVIFIDRQHFTGWTTMQLTRSKEKATGQFSIQVFFEYMPSAPVFPFVHCGKDVMIYIGGNLAFYGTLDNRTGDGKQEGGGGVSRQISITPTKYSITLSGRGKTKLLTQSSQDHKTSTQLNAKTKPAAEELVKNFKTQFDWRAPTDDMDKIRHRDGIVVSDELRRICTEYGYEMWETRDGKMRVTDKSGPETGEPVVLGDNILEFSGSQDYENSNSSVKVKGQRTKKDIRGKKAINCEKTFQDKGQCSYSPLIVQHYGDASDQALEKRGKREIDKLNQQAKQCTVKVFHVMPRSGGAWDVGQLHYVELPPEGIADVMECTQLQYHVDAKGELTTTLTLSPPRAGTMTPNTASRKIKLGIETPSGNYPDSWTAADISEVVDEDGASLIPETTRVSVPTETAPPMTITGASFT